MKKSQASCHLFLAVGSVAIRSGGGNVLLCDGHILSREAPVGGDRSLGTSGGPDSILVLRPSVPRILPPQIAHAEEADTAPHSLMQQLRRLMTLRRWVHVQLSFAKIAVSWLHRPARVSGEAARLWLHPQGIFCNWQSPDERALTLPASPVSQDVAHSHSATAYDLQLCSLSISSSSTRLAACSHGRSHLLPPSI